MLLRISICIVLLVVTLADKDDKKWVWDNNNRSGGRSAAATYPEQKDASARYEIYENGGGSFDNFQENQFNERPFSGNRPSFGRPTAFGPELQQIGPNKRPGGVYGQSNHGSGYGQGQGNYYPDDGQSPGILTGPVPSWEKQGPYKDFDHCKCAEKFNCNSPGISYGHCDVGKQYCCFSASKKGQIGGPLPSRPVHSIENGILVGPGGPIDGPGRPLDGPGNPGFTNYQRPGGRPRPGGYFQRGQQAGFGLGGLGGVRPGFGGPNSYSPENGVLVGPGGPYDRPNEGYRGDGFSPRSANAKRS